MNTATGETVNAAVARTYANAGWSVFPLWWITEDGRCACPRGKLPDDHDDYCGQTSTGAIKGSPGKHPITRNGLKDARRDLASAAAWWCRHPLANIGLPAGDNGLAVIDVDPRKGGDESLRQLIAYVSTKGVDLMNTLTQHTGGDGLHLVYTAPEGGVTNKGNAFGPDLPGLDTRGRGGYIVASPSNHIAGATYDWVDFCAAEAPWPTILTKLMEPKKLTLPAQPKGPVLAGNAEAYAAKALQDEVDAVRATGEGNRNNRLNEAAFNLGQLVAAGKLDAMVVRRELYTAAVATGLGERDAAATILSGLKGGHAKPRVGV